MNNASYGHGITGITNIINLRCIWHDMGGYRGYRVIPSLYYANLSGWAVGLYVTLDKIYFECGDTVRDRMSLADKIYVFIEYTK